MHTEFWWGNLRERDHLEGSGVDGRIILRWILRKWDVGAWTDSEQGQVAGTFVCCKATSVPIKCVEFLD